LREIAGILLEICPPTGKTGKFGSLVFALILPEVNKRESLEIGEKVRKEIESGTFSPWGKGFLTASVGVGENPIDGASAEMIASRALNFMVKAREEGGNRVVGE
jgi:GGDEF domain-containing protein